MEYPRAGLREWYENGPAGLEQGFTLARAERRRHPAEFTIAVSLSGDAHPALLGAGAGATLSGKARAPLTYGDLDARDAKGRRLHIWLTLAAGKVLLHVNARGAEYPIHIDPLIQVGGRLVGGEGAGAGNGSAALSADGKTVLIGSPCNALYEEEEAEEEPPTPCEGEAWVFKRSGSVWRQQATLIGEGESGEGLFGFSVALSADGNTALVGGEADNEGTGAAWVFTRSGSTWTQQGEKLTGGEEVGRGQFGIAVALSSNGNTALIGGFADSGFFGAAWVFTRSGSSWSQQGPKLTGEEGGSYRLFGASVGLSGNGNTAIVAGPDGEAGGAWVFTRSGGAWTQQGPELTGAGLTDEYCGYQFGASVAIASDGDTVMIGGRETCEAPGAAWVYTRSGESWTQQAHFTGSEASAGAGFGSSVALSADGDTGLVGGPQDHDGLGAVWQFKRTGSSWAQNGHKLVESGVGRFGSTVALSANAETILAAKPNGYNGSASAWIFHPGAIDPRTHRGGENPSAPKHPCPVCGDPVVASTGDFFQTQTDISIGGRGVGLDLARTYNSQSAAEGESGAFGYGWTTTFADRLVREEIEEGEGEVTHQITIFQSNGSTVQFLETEPGVYAPAAWSEDRLIGGPESTYTLTTPDQTVYVFDGATGRLESVTDRNGNATTLSYGEAGRLAAITDPAERKITLTYNPAGRVESAEDPMGHTVKYSYEGGNLASVTEPGETGPRWQFKYDGSHQMTEMLDGRAGKTVNEYDGAHRLVTQTDPAKREFTFEYIGSETKIENVNTGEVSKEAFNALGEPEGFTSSGGTGSETREFRYDVEGNLLSSASETGATIEYTYDERGNRTSTRDADGNEASQAFNGQHEVCASTTPNGQTTIIERDAHGNVTEESSSVPGKEEEEEEEEVKRTTFTYDPHGDLEEKTDPLNRKWHYEYDPYGDRTAETDAEGHKRTWGYDEDSNVTSMVSVRGHVEEAEESDFMTTTERDLQERPIKIIDPQKHETTYEYDGDGNVESETDAVGDVTHYTYDADNEQTKVEAPEGRVTETGYDGAGEVISRTDGNEHTTKYVRNSLGEVTESTDPLGRKTLKEYDAAGNLKKVTDPEEHTTTYSYDAANRIAEIDYSSEATPDVKFEYDADGNRTKIVDGTGTSEYHYDQLDRLTESKDGHGDVVAYEYDLADEPTKIIYPGNRAVIRGYDEAGRLESVTDWLGHTTKFAYDADSDPTSTTFPASSGNVDQYTYERDGALESATFKKGAETLASIEYARNKDMQVTKATATGLPGEEEASFMYDKNGRLGEGAGAEYEYEYDPANQVSAIGGNAYSYDEAGELEGARHEETTVATYSYDELGERTSSKPSSGPATTYGYDQAGHLTSVARAEEGEVAAIEDAYGYDGAGLRASQTISGSASYLTWDVAEKLPLLLSDGSLAFIYGPGGLPIEQISGETVHYLHHDEQGSTRLITSSSGTVAGSTTFDAYGNKLASSGVVTSPLGYDGQLTDADTGLIYLRARYYDPATAQFVSVDPEVYESREAYGYASDDPIDRQDLNGLCPAAAQFSRNFTRKLVRLRETVVGRFHVDAEKFGMYEDAALTGYWAIRFNLVEGNEDASVSLRWWTFYYHITFNKVGTTLARLALNIYTADTPSDLLTLMRKVAESAYGI